MGLRFEHTQWLAALALVPLLAAAMAWAAWRKRRLLARFADAPVLSRLLGAVSRPRQRAKAAILLVAMTLLFFTLARPQYGRVEQDVRRKGLDLFIALDVSESMLTADMGHATRLERAKEQLKGLIRKLKGDRVGIIAFAGAAYVQCPLTLDYGLAIQILDTIEMGVVPTQGTALGEAIQVSAASFESNEAGHRAVVLLTDGEDSGSEPLVAAAEAAKNGIVIYAIGIGSEEGAPIPARGGGFKEDAEGHKVNSRLDFDTLAQMAGATGGKAFKARESGFMELDAVYDDLQSIEKKSFYAKSREMFQERFQYFLLPAILLLVLEMSLGDRRRVKREAAAGAISR